MISDEQVERLLIEIRNLSHGGQSGPLGMEAVVMALGGKGSPGDNSVARALDTIANSLTEVADAINNLANATANRHESE
jgi:hypothetical protein